MLSPFRAASARLRVSHSEPFDARQSPRQIIAVPWAAGVDLLCFGIVVILVVELGLITPVVGMNVFTVKSVVRGVVPFIVADLVALLLIFLLPSIATGLPGFMS